MSEKFRIEKRSNFTVVSNAILMNNFMSMKATCLLLKMLGNLILLGTLLAEIISNKLNVKITSAFAIVHDTKTLSPKTVLEHHRLISTVLEQALKEGLVAVNVASRATLPKVERKEVNYFQPEQLDAIREALEQEPLKWKTLVHMLLITGAQRGEVLGLKWDNVDFENNRVYICNSVLYYADIGIYESTPKTEKSKRYIYLPAETMQLLRTYRFWQNAERERLDGYYLDRGFVFAQDNGAPMHPDSVTDYLKKLSKRYGLPHLNPPRFQAHNGLHALLQRS